MHLAHCLRHPFSRHSVFGLMLVSYLSRLFRAHNLQLRRLASITGAVIPTIVDKGMWMRALLCSIGCAEKTDRRGFLPISITACDHILLMFPACAWQVTITRATSQNTGCANRASLV